MSGLLIFLLILLIFFASGMLGYWFDPD